VVESVGEGVTHLKPGDSIMFLFCAQCNECRVCTSGINNACLDMLSGVRGLLKDGTSRFTCRGQSIGHFIGTSTFTEFTVVNVANCVQINSQAPLEKVCLLSCGISTGYGGAVNTAKVRPGSTCAVFGLGAIGLATIMGCKDAKAGQIVAIDINDDKFELAKELGATECINPKNLDMPIEKYLQREFDGGMDFTFECIGLIETIKQAWESAFMGHGECILIGVAPMDKELAVSPFFSQMGRVLKGSLFGGFKSRDDVPKLVERHLAGELNLDKFITHNMALDEINAAFDLLKSGKCIRTVINIQDK
jgi:S-(hydroxymethyl)glutathione dehydrogenase/alcohol dehydrogenase